MIKGKGTTTSADKNVATVSRANIIRVKVFFLLINIPFKFYVSYIFLKERKNNKKLHCSMISDITCTLHRSIIYF